MSSSKLGHEQPLRRTRVLARRYLRYGTRSAAEFRAHLEASGVAEPLIEALIHECLRNGLLDDRICAKLWATRLADRGYAWEAIHARLRAKGLDATLIHHVLTPLQTGAADETRARALARQRLTSRRRDDRHRTARWLAQRGFDSDLIDRVLADSLGPVSE